LHDNKNTRYILTTQDRPTRTIYVQLQLNIVGDGFNATINSATIFIPNACLSF